jgi:hypothetical protein
VRTLLRFAISAAALLISSLPTHAAYNSTAIGTVVTLQQNAAPVSYITVAETFNFTISGQPNISCGGTAIRQFAVSPNSVPDAQTRKNMLALLMFAKATGGQVEIAYDNTPSCDQGMLQVYYIVAL